MPILDVFHMRSNYKEEFVPSRQNDASNIHHEEELVDVVHIVSMLQYQLVFDWSICC